MGSQTKEGPARSVSSPKARANGGSQKDRAKVAKAGQKTKQGRKGKTAASRRGRPTREARERATGLIDPSLSVVTKDPLRVQIIAIAVQRAISPSEFRREANIPLNVASYHFKVLRDHGFLEIVELQKVRGSTRHMHIATKNGFLSDADWGQVEQALRPGVAGQILQDFNGRVGQAMETGTMYERDDACLYWVPRDLDEIAYLEQVKMIAWCIEESARLEVETVKRRASGEGQASFPVTFAIAGFPSPTSKQVKGKKTGTRKKKREKTQGRKTKKG